MVGYGLVMVGYMTSILFGTKIRLRFWILCPPSVQVRFQARSLEGEFEARFKATIQGVGRGCNCLAQWGVVCNHPRRNWKKTEESH